MSFDMVAVPLSQSDALLRSAAASKAAGTSILAAFAASMSTLAAVASAAVAIFAIRNQRKWNASDALIRLATQFELPEFRNHRRIVYGLDRNSYKTWTDDEKNAVGAWCAHLDLMAVLVRSGHLDILAFLQIYGDVVLRSIYQVAPYCNDQADSRGPQFLLPLRMLTTELIKTWRQQARQRRYPITIGFPTQPHIKMNPDLFDSDAHVLKFRINSKLP